MTTKEKQIDLHIRKAMAYAMAKQMRGDERPFGELLLEGVKEVPLTRLN